MRAPQKARPVEANIVQRRPILSMTHVDTRLTGIPTLEVLKNESVYYSVVHLLVVDVLCV